MNVVTSCAIQSILSNLLRYGGRGSGFWWSVFPGPVHLPLKKIRKGAANFLALGEWAWLIAGVKTIQVKLIGGPEMFDGTDYDAQVMDCGGMAPEVHRLFIDLDTGNTRVAIYRHDGENYRFSHVGGWEDRYHKPFSPTSGDQL